MTAFPNYYLLKKAEEKDIMSNNIKENVALENLKICLKYYLKKYALD